MTSTLLNFLALLGTGISIFLTEHFYDVRQGTGSFKSFCNISAAANCDVVAASPYAELPFGIPLSSAAIGWYLALFFCSLFLHNRFWRREAARACFALALLGTLFSLPYLLIMIFKLKTYCLMCLALDAVNLASLGLVLVAFKPEGFSIHKLDLAKWKVLLGGSLVSLVLPLLIFRLFYNDGYRSSDVNNWVDQVLNTPPVSIQTGVGKPAIGPDTAPITIVEFSDFQCPYCRIGALTVNTLMNRYPGKIRMEFRNFPLDQSCNPDSRFTPHPVACDAARVALCAHKMDKFELVYDQLFEEQASFVPGKPQEIGKKMGLETNALQGCTQSPEVASMISRDLEEAKLLGVTATPTFFFNGHRMEGSPPLQVWDKIIERLLNGK